MKWWTRWRDTIALAFVAAAFLWSVVVVVASRRTAAHSEDEIVLRIAHWQLEAGFRDAINEMAEEYRRTVNPRVRVIQDAIPEGTYGQWASSQLVGGTPPDIIAPFTGLPSQVWVNYLNRYCIPLTEWVRQPNPYNKGTDLEGVPFYKTYEDQMQSGYVEELQHYASVPIFATAIRLFYNADLLQRLTGTSEPPKNLQDFERLCETIAAKKDAHGRNYVPIVGSSYHAGMWEWAMFQPLTWSLLFRADLNRDGFVAGDEFFAAVKSGTLGFDEPVVRARLDIVQDITRFFQPGWLGLTRDEGVFLFAQQRAVFIPTGTWDAKSLQEQAKGSFAVRVMPFPFPTRDDPKFGRFAIAPPYDRPGNNRGFAVTRGSKHSDVAFDFLRFLASKKGNERFNNIIGWIPAVSGVRPPDFLAGFEPVYRGQYNAFYPTLGGLTEVQWNQLYQLFQIDQLSAGDLIKQYKGIYLKDGQADFDEVQRNWERSLRISDQFLAAVRHDLLDAAPAQRDRQYLQYVRLTTGRLLFPPLDQVRLLRLANSKQASPYIYSPAALQNLQRQSSTRPTTKAAAE